VPPGWDRWLAVHNAAAYYRYRATFDGDIVDYGFNEGDVKDKPHYLRDQRWLTGEHRREIDTFRLDQIRSLQAVDRLVGERSTC
jgi:hypothetical protein